MAVLNKTNVDRAANRQYIGDRGNEHAVWRSYTFAGAAIADVAYLGKLPGGTVLLDSRVVFASLGGEDVTIKVGYIKVNSAGSMTNDDDYFFEAASAENAGGGRIPAANLPVTLTEDAYLVATVGGAVATGRLDLVVKAVYAGPLA